MKQQRQSFASERALLRTDRRQGARQLRQRPRRRSEGQVSLFRIPPFLSSSLPLFLPFWGVVREVMGRGWSILGRTWIRRRQQECN
eukprot:3644142-Rhodomonas_salina.3